MNKSIKNLLAEIDDAVKWPTLGILGGMGPLAAATFITRLVQLTPASNDQNHIPVLLRNDPRIPDRSSALLHQAESPLPALLHGANELVQWGAQAIAIPCNTAHYWYQEIQDAINVPVIHIVQAVIEDLQRNGVTQGKVGILGTSATMQLGLYQKALSLAGYEPITGSEHLTQLSAQAIVAVKSNRIASAFAPAAQAVNRLLDQGVQAVVLGCTELPLAIEPARRCEFNGLLTDSIDALAKAVICGFIQSSREANP